MELGYTGFFAPISIHAPRVGSDQRVHNCGAANEDFNPRSPCGERRDMELRNRIVLVISIHAPRVGSDSHSSMSLSAIIHFNPRSPCGERPQYILLFRTKNNIL